jgi:hypothetical protein
VQHQYSRLAGCRGRTVGQENCLKKKKEQHQPLIEVTRDHMAPSRRPKGAAGVLLCDSGRETDPQISIFRTLPCKIAAVLNTGDEPVTLLPGGISLDLVGQGASRWDGAHG